jgi:hypothetical protein
MTVRSGQVIVAVFTTRRFDTGAATNADSLPTATLYVNGVASGTVPTVANITTGIYSASVTLPTLAWGDDVQIRINATVNSVTDNAVIWSDMVDVAINSAGAVTAGTVSDKTGYSLTQTFPANFSSLAINSSGHVSRVTLVDTTTTNTDMRGTDGAALASAWTATRAGYLDSVLIAANSNRTVKVTGSNHVAADIHELQPDVITAAGVASDVGDEIAAAVRVNLATELGRVDAAVSSRLATSGYTTPPTAATIADTVLGRSMSNVQATAAEHSLCTMVLGATESAVSGTTWTIYQTDGTTTYRSKTITTDGTAEPIVSVS